MGDKHGHLGAVQTFIKYLFGFVEICVEWDIGYFERDGAKIIQTEQVDGARTDEGSKRIEDFIGCKSNDLIFFTQNYEKLNITKIEIDINKYKKWSSNNIKILTNPTRFTPDRLKKRFKGQVVTSYEDGTICVDKANIRHSGDAKDHIVLKDSLIIQSLDVNLQHGNIKGITQFKLFKPNVRGNLEDVVIQNILAHF